MPPDGSIEIMGRSQTSTEEHTTVSHSTEPINSNSESFLSYEPRMDREVADVRKRRLSGESRRDSSNQPEKPRNAYENDRIATASLTDRKWQQEQASTDAKSVNVIDVMDLPTRVDIVWRNVGLFAYLHIVTVYGLYLLATGQVMWQTFVWTCLMHMCGAVGITAGAHRYWSHKSYKAKLPLRVILVFMQTVAVQNSIHEWSRDHRVHHKYSETNADPHNAKRGFFFAHMGWLLCRKHPAVKVKGKQIDMSDLEADPLVMFQKNHYLLLVLAISFFMPAFVAWYFWGESLISAWCFAAQLRYCCNLHVTWFVNSAAHLWGNKPYDKNINPVENKAVSIFAFGEGWHNYHHVFPWDYKAAELGRYKYNFTTAFIEFFAWIGWAYDLKTVSDKVVRDRVRRTGDGSWGSVKHSSSANVSTMESLAGSFHGGPWGWGDKDIQPSDSKVTQTLYPLMSSFEN